MEQIVIILCIVIVILLCCYRLVKFILSIREENRLASENDELIKDINYFSEKFRSCLMVLGVDDTIWGNHQLKLIDEYIKNELDIHPLLTAKEKHEIYFNLIPIIKEKYENFKNELISNIIPEIDYNFQNWSRLLIDFPKFFVAESVGGIKNTLYCYSHNMEFNSSNFTFSGIVFTNVNNEGCIRSFSPKNWGIRVMSDYEFHKIFLPDILDKCHFNDIRELKDYSNYLKKEFKNFKEKYE
jgi:hypothetical protein